MRETRLIMAMNIKNNTKNIQTGHPYELFGHI